MRSAVSMPLIATGTFIVCAFGFRVVELVRPLAIIKPLLWVGLIAVVAIFRNSSRLRDVLTRSSIGGVYALLCGWLVVTVPLALYRGAAFSFVLTLPAVFLAFVPALLCTTSRSTFDHFLRMVCIVLSYSSVLALINGATMKGRLTTGGMLDPNDYAALHAFSATLAMGLAFTSRGLLRRILYAGAFFLSTWIIVQTASRGGLIALAVGVIAIVGSLPIRKLLPVIVGGAFVLPLSWPLLPETFRERIGTLSSLNEDYNVTSTEGRLQIWQRGIGHVARHPLTGVGVSNYPVVEGRWHDEQGTVGQWGTAHNSYLLAFVEGGLLGGGLFVALVVICTREAFAYYKWKRINMNELVLPFEFAALLSYFVAIFFLSQAFSYMTASIFGMAAAMAFVRKRGRRSVIRMMLSDVRASRSFASRR